MLLPPMRRKAIDQLTQAMSDIVDAEIDKWPKDGPINLFPLCQTLVRRAALEILFSGVEGRCGHEMLEAARVMDDHIEMESSPLVRGMPRDWPGLPYRRVLRHAEVVQAALQKWARKEASGGREESLLCLIASKPTETGEPGSEEAVLKHLPSLFGAAYETTQTALVWALFLLAQHPKAAGTLLDELNALPDDNPERLLECSWLDAVVRESLRILPSVPTQTRRATQATDLLDRELEAGTFVVLSSFLSHREPDVFSEPDRFKPERWAEIDPNQWAFLPFSAGPRTCMGSWFANNFLQIALGRITKRYRLKVTPGARIDAKVRITLRPGRSGVPVTVSAQDGRFDASPTGGNIHNLVRFDA
jgi:cytochrome P450